MQFKTSGLIIRQRRLNNDRFVEILTPEKGVIKAVARGALSPRSKLSSSTEMFCFINANMFCYKDNYTIDDAEPIGSFYKLRYDLLKYSLACYFADLCSQLAPSEEEATDYCNLMLNSLHILLDTDKTLDLVKSAFELRIISMSGYMPDIVKCSCCGRDTISINFSVSSGICFCAGCSSKEETIEINEAVTAAMRHIILGSKNRIFAFSLSDKNLRTLSDIAERYTIFHLQRRLKTLDFFHSITAFEKSSR